MPGLPIAVEISPADAPHAHVTVMLAACGRASAEAECVPAAEVGEGGSRAVAIVTWHGQQRVIVEVGLRREGRPEWRTRAIDFDRQDDSVERWRTIGFVVGTLSRPEMVSSQPAAGAEKEAGSEAKQKAEQKLESLPVAAPEPKPEPKPPAPAVPKKRTEPRPPLESASVRASRDPRPPSRATLDLGGTMGPALDGLRSGALARTRLRVLEALAAVFAVRYLERPIGDGSFGGRWFGGAAGLGVGLGDEELLLFTSVDARVEYFRGRAQALGSTASAGRWLSGVGLGMNVGWMPSDVLGVFLGADGAWMFGSTDVQVRGERVATDEALRVGVEGGVRLRLW